MTDVNAKCPCGSGKIFRHCHGKTGQSSSPSVLGVEVAVRERKVVEALKAGNLQRALDLVQALPGGERSRRLQIMTLIKIGTTDNVITAVGLLEEWHLLKPGDPEALQRLVETHIFLERFADARMWLDKLCSVTGSTIDPRYYQAIILQLQRLSDRALDALLEIQLSHSSKPAVARVEAAMQLNNIAGGHFPGSPGSDPMMMLDHQEEQGLLHDALGRWQKAVAGGGAVISDQDRNTVRNAWYNLGCYLMSDFDRVDQCVANFDQALEMDPDHLPSRINRLFVLNYSNAITPASLFSQHRDNGEWLGRAVRASPLVTVEPTQVDRPLRVAYLSSDFRRHSVAFFILPVLRHHDRARFHVTVYHNNRSEDDYTARIRQASDQFVRVHELDDEALGKRIRQDNIDILIELNGLTSDHRMALMARRCAPLQMTWLGYPNTTGLKTVDYRIVDRLTDPPETAQQRLVEKALYLPRVFSVYQALADLPETVDSPAKVNGFVTFGSFNFLPKLNVNLLRSWADILFRVDDSRLLIKNMALSFESPRRRVAAALESIGIDPRRIHLVGRTVGSAQHLEYYQQVDISLDTYPYNGTTTTCDSLIMGVPVVSRFGEDHRSRVGLSQLTAVGLESLASASNNGYIDRAVAVAIEAELLASVRKDLRQRMMASALMDGAGLTSDLEQALRATWLAHSANEQ